MTKIPAHTVQHLKSSYGRYQIMAIVFTIITLAAALLAMVSGFQAVKLRKMQLAEHNKTAPAQVQPVKPRADDALHKQIKSLQDQLATEKAASRKLKTKIQELERNIATPKDSPAE